MGSIKGAKCPECGADIELTEAIIAPILEAQAQKYESELSKQSEALSVKEEELEQLSKTLKNRAKELELQKQAAAEEIELAVAEKLRDEKKKIEKEQALKAREAVKAELAEEMELLQGQLSEKSAQIQDMRKKELQLLRDKEEIEAQRENLELEVARKLSEERDRLRSEAKEQAQQESVLALADKDKKLADLTKQIEDLKRKADQGSQQSQGEVLEILLRDALTAAFPLDDITDVPKGINGADCIQKVHSGKSGMILWECKRTKSFNQDWVGKLKDDQRTIGADIAVLVTATLPNGVQQFSQIDGVWVVSIPLATQLAAALRTGLIEVSSARQAASNQSGKMEIMYEYLTGPAFKRRIEGIVEPFTSMKDGLEKEKRAMSKIWAEREQQINRVIVSAAGMHGDLQGIIGQALPEIDSLRLIEE